MKLKIGFLASHGGSNFSAICNNVRNGKLDAELCVLISNNSGSGAIEKARNFNIPAFHVSDKNSPNGSTNRIIELFDQHCVNIVVLAGYMKKLDKELIEHFGGKVLNIHPALLPKFGGAGMYGMNVHKAVIEAKETHSGATIHLVDPEYDNGRVLLQAMVEVLSSDTAESLAERVLAQEHILYTEALIKISNDEIVIP